MEIVRIAALSYKKVHGPYDKGDGRKIVIVVYHNGKKRTVSYPKHIMEMHLGYELLDTDITIDHWDTDKNNNDINNLRIIDRKQHSTDDTRRVKLIELECAWCNKKFERSPRLLRDKSKKNKAGPFCSRKCAGKYSRMLQLKLIDKLHAQPFIESEYYKKKYVEADIDYELLYAFIKNI